jgi:acetoin utilization protein AcuB
MPDEEFRLIDLVDDLSAGRNVFFELVYCVKDVMTKNVKTLAMDGTIEKCLKFMEENHVRHIPIVDKPTGVEETPCFIGIVSQRDVFRQISPYAGKVGQTDSDLTALKQPLMQIVTRDPKSASPETHIKDMISIMVDNTVNMVPVLVDRYLVGIVTSADILKLFIRLDKISKICTDMEETGQRRGFVDLLSGKSDEVMPVLSNVLRTVADIMTQDVICLEEENNLAEALEVMQQNKIRHVMVVDKQKNLVGVISDRDVLRYLPFLRPGAEAFHDRLYDVAPNNVALKQVLRDIIKREVISVPPSCDFYSAVGMLYDKNISCLPVIDEDKKPVGIVTVTDVMRGLKAAYELHEKSMVN